MQSKGISADEGHFVYEEARASAKANWFLIVFLNCNLRADPNFPLFPRTSSSSNSSLYIIVGTNFSDEPVFRLQEHALVLKTRAPARLISFRGFWVIRGPRIKRHEIMWPGSLPVHTAKCGSLH